MACTNTPLSYQYIYQHTQVYSEMVQLEVTQSKYCKRNSNDYLKIELIHYNSQLAVTVYKAADQLTEYLCSRTNALLTSALTDDVPSKKMIN